MLLVWVIYSTKPVRLEGSCSHDLENYSQNHHLLWSRDLPLQRDGLWDTLLRGRLVRKRDRLILQHFSILCHSESCVKLLPSPFSEVFLWLINYRENPEPFVNSLLTLRCESKGVHLNKFWNVSWAPWGIPKFGSLSGFVWDTLHPLCVASPSCFWGST